MYGITIRGQESPVKGLNCGFLSIFPNLGHLERYTPPPPWIACFWYFISQNGCCVQVLHALSGSNKPCILVFTNYSDLSILIISKSGVPLSSSASRLALIQVFLILTYFLPKIWILASHNYVCGVGNGNYMLKI